MRRISFRVFSAYNVARRSGKRESLPAFRPLRVRGRANIRTSFLFTLPSVGVYCVPQGPAKLFCGGKDSLLAAAVIAAYAGQNEDKPYEVATVGAAAASRVAASAAASATVEYEHKKNQVAAIATTTTTV